MFWLSSRIMERRPGTPGRIIILVDATPSVSPVNKARICKEADAILSRERGARLWAFGTAVVDITSDPSAIKRPIWDCFPGATDGYDWRKSRGVEGTYLGRALAAAAQVNPERTVILCDGGTADKAHAFRVADSMTGVIDAFYLHPRREEYDLEHHFISANDLWRHYSRGADRSVMQELARRGGGTFEVYPTRAGVYSDYGIREGHMSRHNVRGGPVNIYGPPRQQHVVEEHIDVFHQRVFNHHWGPDQHVHHGAPPPTDIHVDPAQVTYHASKEAIRQVHKPNFFAFLFSPSTAQQQALPAPQPQYRGELRAEPAPVPHRAALPPPQAAPQASPQRHMLPPPAPQPANGRPQPAPALIEHKPQVPAGNGWFSRQKVR